MSTLIYLPSLYILILAQTAANSSSSSWDSIHVFEAETPNANKPTHYKLTSTIILSLSTSSNSLGSVSLAGNLTRQFETDVMAKDDTAHVVNVGRMVEEMEGKMRNMLQEVYFGKTRDVVGDLRSKYSPFCSAIGCAVLLFLCWERHVNSMLRSLVFHVLTISSNRLTIAFGDATGSSCAEGGAEQYG